MKKDEELPPELYRIARGKGTEAPFTGKYWDAHEKGMYKCAICGTELFSSDTKFDSGTGWPSFTEPANLEHIELRTDETGGVRRTEVVCKKCGAHLGMRLMMVRREGAESGFASIQHVLSWKRAEKRKICNKIG